MTPTLFLNDGRTIPAIGFGLWQVPAEDTARVVEDGLAAGFRLVDGAAIYGNEEGMGEGLRRAALPRDARIDPHSESLPRLAAEQPVRVRTCELSHVHTTHNGFGPPRRESFTPV